MNTRVTQCVGKVLKAIDTIINKKKWDGLESMNIEVNLTAQVLNHLISGVFKVVPDNVKQDIINHLNDVFAQSEYHITRKQTDSLIIVPGGQSDIT